MPMDPQNKPNLMIDGPRAGFGAAFRLSLPLQQI